MLCIHDMYSHHSANDSSKLHGDFCIENVMAVIKCCAFTTCTATSECSNQTIAVNKGNYMVISAFNDIGTLAHRDPFPATSPSQAAAMCVMVPSKCCSHLQPGLPCYQNRWHNLGTPQTLLRFCFHVGCCTLVRTGTFSLMAASSGPHRKWSA